MVDSACSRFICIDWMTDVNNIREQARVFRVFVNQSRGNKTEMDQKHKKTE